MSELNFFTLSNSNWFHFLDRYVRKSILFSYTIILLVTPEVQLASLLRKKLGEMKLWLESNEIFSNTFHPTILFISFDF